MHTRKARPFVIEMTLAIKCNKRNLKIVNSAQRWVVMDVPRWPNLRVNSPWISFLSLVCLQVHVSWSWIEILGA